MSFCVCFIFGGSKYKNTFDIEHTLFKFFALLPNFLFLLLFYHIYQSFSQECLDCFQTETTGHVLSKKIKEGQPKEKSQVLLNEPRSFQRGRQVTIHYGLQTLQGKSRRDN